MEALHSAVAANARAYVVRVRLWMAAGLMLGALAAWLLDTRPETAARLLADPGAFWGLIALTLATGFSLGGWRRRFTPAQAGWAFFGFAALNGTALAAALRAWIGLNAAPAFLAAAGAFLAGDLVALRGARRTTTWAWMCSVGLLLGGPLSERLGGALPETLAAYAAVVIFTALAAYDDERLRRLGAQSGGETREAARGALALYLDGLGSLLDVLRRK